MKLAIVGGRELHVSNSRINEQITLIEDELGKKVTCIVSGGARGIDTCAASYATEMGLELEVYRPDWDKVWSKNIE